MRPRAMNLLLVVFFAAMYIAIGFCVGWWIYT